MRQYAKVILGVWLFSFSGMEAKESINCQPSPDGMTLNCADGVWVKGPSGGYVRPEVLKMISSGQGGPASYAASSQSPQGEMMGPHDLSAPPSATPNTGRPSSTDGAPRRKGEIAKYQSHGKETADNPGFSFDMHSRTADRKLSSCSATWFNREGSRCFALSSTHCFESTVAANAAEPALFCQNNADSEGKFLKVPFRMNTSHTGVVEATATLTKSYLTEGHQDVAVIEWECPTAPSMKMVPLCNSPVQDGEPVKYGKVKGNAGLHSGVVQQTYQGDINGEFGSASAEDDLINVRQTEATDNGDSGGPLISERNGCLIAPLSGSYSSGPFNGFARYGRGSNATAAQLAQAMIREAGSSRPGMDSMAQSSSRLQR